MRCVTRAAKPAPIGLPNRIIALQTRKPTVRHSSPPALKMALDLAKKLALDLGPRLSPEQRRDMTRLQTLIEDAERAVAAASRPAPAPGLRAVQGY